MTNKKLSSSLKQYDQNLTKTPLEISGRLGIPLGGQRLVQVPTRKAFVYVRLRNNQNELIQAYNNQVAPAYDLPVRVVREGNKYVIAGVDTAQYENNWTSYAPFLPMHGDTHSMTLDDVGGGDPVWIYGRQFMPMLGIPSGSAGGPNLIVTEHILRKPLDSNWLHMGNTGTPDLTPYRPTGSTALMVLVYMDSETGNPGILVGSGTPMPATYTGTSQIVPYLPKNYNPMRMAVSAVRLVSGTTVLGWDNIYDVRQYFPPVPTGSAGGLSSIAVQDEGVSQGSATTFNFVGGRLIASVAGSVARIEVSPDPQELIGIMAKFEGAPLGTGTILDVYGVGLSLSGTTLIMNGGLITVGAAGIGTVPNSIGVSITGTQVGGIGADENGLGVIFLLPEVARISVWDEGIPKGTGTTFDFVGNGVDVSVSGSVIRVHISGSVGGSGIPSGTVQVFNSGSFVGSVDQLDFQYPLAVGITGSRGYPYLRGTLLVYEDVSYQVTGSSNSHYSLSGSITPGTDRLYFNGLRQKRTTHYTVDGDGRGFTTMFSGTPGDTMIMEYGNAATGPATAISDTGSSGGGDMVKLFDFCLASPTGSFVFAGIPPGYTHLIIKASLRGVAGTSLAGQMFIEVNGDSSVSNYTTFGMETYPTGSVGIVMEESLASNGSHILGYFPGPSANSRIFSSEEWELLDYANLGKQKSIHRKGAFLGTTTYGTHRIIDRTVWWENTGTISILKITSTWPTTGSFAAESRMTMYGLR